MNLWWNKWVNLIEEPDPIDTITAALGVIANRIATREDTSNNPEVSVVNRLQAIADSLEGLDADQLIPILTLITGAITALTLCRKEPTGSSYLMNSTKQ